MLTPCTSFFRLLRKIPCNLTVLLKLPSSRLALDLSSHLSEYSKAHSAAQQSSPTQVRIYALRSTAVLSPDYQTHPSSPLCSFLIEFVSPAVVRSAIRREKGSKYKVRKQTETERHVRREERRREEDELAVHKVFA